MGKPIQQRGKWRIRWDDENGQRQSSVFESYREAVSVLRLREGEAEQAKRGIKGAAPVEAVDELIGEIQSLKEKMTSNPESIAETKTFDELADYYIDVRKAGKKSRIEAMSVINYHLRPTLGVLTLNQIGIEQVDRIRQERLHLDKATRNNIYKILTAMFNVAIELKWLDKSQKPEIEKEKVPKYNMDFKYLKTKEEMDRFLMAAQEEGEAVYALYCTALFSGMRLGELAGLKKSCVDFEKRFMMVKTSYDAETKNEEIRFVPILDPLLPVLRSWLLKTDSQFVFPNKLYCKTGMVRDHEMLQPAAPVSQETLHRVLERAGFPKVEIKKKLRRYISFHDLRHSFASHYMMGGGDLFRLQKILGHRTAEMTQRYAHLSPHVFAQDYGRLGHYAAGSEIAPVIPYFRPQEK